MTSKRNVLGTCILRPGKKKEKSFGDLYFETWKKERKKEKAQKYGIKEKYNLGPCILGPRKRKKPQKYGVENVLEFCILKIV